MVVGGMRTGCSWQSVKMANRTDGSI